MENLPLPLIWSESLTLLEILQTNYGEVMTRQYHEFVDMCNFLREILTTLYNEQMLTISWDEDEQMSDETRKQVKNLRIVKEAFLVSFFQMILC
jgi:hypothetical protein